jgi:hypothetical protein
MNDEIVVSEEPDYCEACSGGWGHEVDMTDGYECEFWCRTCEEELVVDAHQVRRCCGHRYVGERLWGAEKYYNTWDCPECDGEYMEHKPFCSMSSESDEDDDEDDEDDDGEDYDEDDDDDDPHLRRALNRATGPMTELLLRLSEWIRRARLRRETRKAIKAVKKRTLGR